MNYTRPNDPDHKDTPQDWLNSALIFGMAVSALLADKSGVVIDIKGDATNPVGDSKKVIVFRLNELDNFEQDLPEGTICKVEEQ